MVLIMQSCCHLNACIASCSFHKCRMCFRNQSSGHCDWQEADEEAAPQIETPIEVEPPPSDLETVGRPLSPEQVTKGQPKGPLKPFTEEPVKKVLRFPKVKPLDPPTPNAIETVRLRSHKFEKMPQAETVSSSALYFVCPFQWASIQAWDACSRLLDPSKTLV